MSVQRMLGAIKVMTDRDTQFSKILPAHYKKGTDLIAVFKAAKDQPKIGKNKKKTDGTDALSLAIAAGKTFKLSMVEQLVRKYQFSNPKLAETAILRGKTASSVGHNIGKYSIVNQLTMEELDSPVISQSHKSKKGKITTKVFKPIKKEILTFTKHMLGTFTLTVVVPGFIRVYVNLITG